MRSMCDSHVWGHTWLGEKKQMAFLAVMLILPEIDPYTHSWAKWNGHLWILYPEHIEIVHESKSQHLNSSTPCNTCYSEVPRTLMQPTDTELTTPATYLFQLCPVCICTVLKPFPWVHIPIHQLIIEFNLISQRQINSYSLNKLPVTSHYT